MRILVAGRKGFIGTGMVPMLKAEGYDFVELGRNLYRNSGAGEPPAPVDDIINGVRDI